MTEHQNLWKNISSHTIELHILLHLFFPPSPRASSPILSPTKPGHTFPLAFGDLRPGADSREKTHLYPSWPSLPSSGIAKAFQWGPGALCKNLHSRMGAELGTPVLPWEREKTKSTGPSHGLCSYRKEDNLQTLSLQQASQGKLARTHGGRTGHFLPPQSKFF